MINLSSNFQKIVVPLIKKYENKYQRKNIHKYFFDILMETRKEFNKSCKKDAGQSWRNESGAMLENLVVYFIQQEIVKLGYDLATDNQINKASSDDKIMSLVYRNMIVRYGKYPILPDGDIIIFNPKNGDVKAIISCKNSLRERFAQTLYWKLKLSLDPITAPIKMYFVTIDKENGKKPALDIDPQRGPTKPRILLEYEMDGVYVGRELQDESDKVKMFDKFIDDLKNLLS